MKREAAADAKQQPPPPAAAKPKPGRPAEGVKAEPGLASAGSNPSSSAEGHQEAASGQRGQAAKAGAGGPGAALRRQDESSPRAAAAAAAAPSGQVPVEVEPRASAKAQPLGDLLLSAAGSYEELLAALQVRGAEHTCCAHRAVLAGGVRKAQGAGMAAPPARLAMLASFLQAPRFKANSSRLPPHVPVQSSFADKLPKKAGMRVVYQVRRAPVPSA